ncbi:MAG: hypothetical protein NC411_10030 [Bacteroides sp.]|nr:hypothetical protein [Bacteroides sp.]
MRNKLFVYPLLVAAFGMTFVACSSDDDDDNNGNTPAVDMPLPSSIVDGVRITNVGDNAKINYNADGSIKDATIDGITYDFEYETSRAAMTTGRKLARIVSRYSDDEGYSDSWQATNFMFNTDGFIVSYLEKHEEKYDSSWEKTTFNVTVDYNLHGRITSMHVYGDYEGYDEGEGHYSDKGSGTVKYNYVGGSLESSVIEESDTKSTYEFEYYLAHANTYNITTPQLAAGMANYSKIAYVFALTGYLGNASSLLPTKVSYIYVDKEEPENSSTSSYDISYKFNDKNRVTSILSNANGYSYTTSMTYIEQK